MCGFAKDKLICSVCGQPLHFAKGRGYLHPNGSLYVLRCKRCGYKNSLGILPERCPGCGQETVWLDDHCTLPQWIKADA